MGSGAADPGVGQEGNGHPHWSVGNSFRISITSAAAGHIYFSRSNWYICSIVYSYTMTAAAEYDLFIITFISIRF